MNDITCFCHIIASGFYAGRGVGPGNIEFSNFVFLINAVKSSFVNAFPLGFIKMFSDTIFKSGTSSARARLKGSCLRR